MTQQMTKALALIEDGTEPKEAMRESGYSEGSINRIKEKLLDKPEAQDALASYKKKLVERFHDERMLDKLDEFVEAKKVDKFGNVQPEYTVQQNAWRDIARMLGHLQDTPTTAIQINVQSIID